ncbi:MAG: AAA family ATPase [Bacillota bacterium]
MKLAVAGKGGAGKTTVAAALTHCLSMDAGRQVWAVDADPDASLGELLGFPRADLDAQPPLIDLKQLIGDKLGQGAYYRLNPDVDDILDRYALERGQVRLLRMGGVKGGGSECYCRENSFLRAVLAALLLAEETDLVMDMGAGIEHLTRGTAQGVDLLLVVAEPTARSVDTARTVRRLAADIGIGRVRIVGNKARSGADEAMLTSSFAAGELVGMIPHAPQVLDWARQGQPVTGWDGAALGPYRDVLRALRSLLI